MKKNIGICTLFHKNYNYGGILQGYALLKSIETSGHEVSLISYDMNHSVNPIYPTLLSRCIQYSPKEILAKICEVFSSKLHRDTTGLLSSRIRMFDKFISDNIKHTKLVNDNNIKDLTNQYDAFVCGSDQVWNPNAVRRLFLLTIEMDNDVKRISYAASISRDKLSRHEKEIMIPAINDFDFVSVRENTAANILAQSGIKNVKVVIDPTMLLTKDDWNKICTPKMVDKPYVFVYSFSDCPFKDELVNHCKRKGMEVYFLPYAKQQYNGYDGKTTMLPIWDAGPAEFLSLIRYAEFVYTDSFHGSVFSMIFNRDFAVYERDGKGKTSKNSRIYDLLADFRLEKRMIHSDFDSILNVPIDYTTVNAIMDKKRRESMEWLQNAIK